MATALTNEPLAAAEIKSRLRALASAIRTWLRDETHGVAWTEPPSDKLAVTAGDGWYIPVACLSQGGGALELFCDCSAGAEQRRLYYGFCAANLERAREIAQAGNPVYGPYIEDTEVRSLNDDEYGRPFLEDIRAREHYYGIYLSDPQVILADSEAELVARVGGFFADIATALSSGADDRTVPSQGLQPTGRQTGQTPLRPGQGKFRADVLSLFHSRCWLCEWLRRCSGARGCAHPHGGRRR